jgi:hypothetical protein
MCGFMDAELEIVVAHKSSRDFEEIARLLPEAKLTVYDKSGSYKNGRKIKDIGREGYVYLTHIAENYSNLARQTLFIQDDTKNHVPDQFGFLSSVISAGISGSPRFHQFACTWRFGSDIYRRSVAEGICHLDTLGEPDAIKKAAERLGVDLPKEYTTETCAFFMANKEIILGRPLEFYLKAIDWVLERESHEFVLEHMWKIIFEKSAGRIP